MNIPTKTVLKDLSGKELPNNDGTATVGSVIANILTQSTEGSKMKLFALAQKAYNDKTLDVDEADLNLIKKMVDESRVYTTLITGQVLLLLEKVK